jgi:hypothetical protein
VAPRPNHPHQDLALVIHRPVVVVVVERLGRQDGQFQQQEPIDHLSAVLSLHKLNAEKISHNSLIIIVVKQLLIVQLSVQQQQQQQQLRISPGETRSSKNGFNVK